MSPTKQTFEPPNCYPKSGRSFMRSPWENCVVPQQMAICGQSADSGRRQSGQDHYGISLNSCRSAEPLARVDRARHQRHMTAPQISAGRQILVSLGNRYVVFGPPTGLPSKAAFDPSELGVLPRVSDESEVAGQRIVETIKVAGLSKIELDSTESAGDIEFQDEKGRSLFVDIKTRDGPVRRADYDRAFSRAREAAVKGRQFETWFFNIDRLSLTTIGVPDPHRETHWEPVEVWEKTKDSLFGRADVIESVNKWQDAVSALFAFVRESLQADNSLEFDTSRRYTMSEELMQKFAVPDRELPILDVVQADEVLASFIPRALWVIGSFGRVDVITRSGTTLLVRVSQEEDFNWQIVDRSDRRKLSSLDAETIRGLLA